MPKINQEEYEILKGLDDICEWIARDKSGSLFVYEEKSYKIEGFWSWGDNGEIYRINEPLFLFIKWADEEPYNIAELIREYEKHEFVKINHEGQERLNKLFGNESEEKEMKDIEWLRKEFDDLFNGKSILTVGKSVVDEIINQLDEPEVLLQEWLDEHLFSLGDKYPWKEAVPVVDLQNLLVPKRERLTIPNYVAKWISEHHEKFDLYPALRRLEEGSTRDYDAYKWYRANTLKFVTAYLTGVYEVEEERKLKRQ